MPAIKPTSQFCRLGLTGVLAFCLAQSAVADDWPAYRHDSRRSAVSKDQIEFPLSPGWRHKSQLPPQPAFADPLAHPTGVDFAYIRDHSEPVLLVFDHAFHPVAAGGRVFFGSSADDSIRCLSLKTGEQEWVYVTGGPVRFAPQIVDDRLYAASDDGFVYCLLAATGKLVWKFRAAPSARQLVGNGRMISRWPLRTGLLVVDGVVYVTAGMWPAEGVFIYALDANTGNVIWVNDTSGTVNLPTKNAGAYAIAGVAPTGYLLAGNGALVVPTGRSIPASYALMDGRLLATVAPSYQNRDGGPATCIDPHGSVIFGSPRERLTGRDYSVHYAYRLPLMQRHGTLRADRVITDDKTYVAVNDLIRCYSANSRYTKISVNWQADCPSRRLRCLALSANALLMGIDNSIVARDRETGDVVWRQDDLDGYVRSLAIVDNGVLVATDAGSVYSFISTRVSTPQRVDTGRPTRAPQQPQVAAIDGQTQKALQLSPNSRGMALVIGRQDSFLATQLAADSQLQVVLLLDDARAVTATRNKLLDRWESNHGHVSVQQHLSDKPLPFADYSFNFIVATNDVAIAREAELRRVLRPAGGTLLIENASEDATATFSPVPTAKDDLRREGNHLVLRRGKLPGALDWDSETTTDQRVKWPLELLWFGGPGSKRTGSGSRAPVAAGGRNFVIGKNHLIALDAYNGTELWSRTLPYLYRNIGRLRNAPGPIAPWLTKSISADDDNVYLNFGHVVHALDGATGEQKAVYGQIPVAREFQLAANPRFTLDRYMKPSTRGTTAIPTSTSQPAGSIELTEDRESEEVKLMLRMSPGVEISKKVYWEIFLDVRPRQQRATLYDPGIFQLLAWPAEGRVATGIGPAHPKLKVTVRDKGREMEISLPLREMTRLSGGSLDDFAFAAALNQPAGTHQKLMAAGRGYLRWEVHCDSHAYAFNNGWARIVRDDKSFSKPIDLPATTTLPAHALRAGRIGSVGPRAGYVVKVDRQRTNPLSLEIDGFEYNRGKGCGNPVACGSLHVLRSGTLAFYDLTDDSGMRYFGGVRPSCTVSAVPAQGVVFAAEGSSGCSCNYNFKTSLALAPASQRRHEDWAMYMAPLSPAALLRTGNFNLGAPGDRRDNKGKLWLQYPRAPTYSNRSMPVPVELLGDSIVPYRINADRVPISDTKRPWLYTSGFEGIEGVRLQLFMSDKDGIIVFPGHTPQLDASIEEAAWDRRYAVSAGTGSTMFVTHGKDALYIGYEIVPAVDRRGKRKPWRLKGTHPYSARFELAETVKDAPVWDEDSLEFLIGDTTLKSILHFGLGVSGGRYDGRWSTAKKTEEAKHSSRWSAAINVTAEKAIAEIAIPWKTLSDAGLNLEDLVIRPRTRQPLVRQPHISHGFRPLLLQTDEPKEKRYRVALHFAELSDLKRGDRVFDVQLQGKTLLKNFDPIAAAGGRHRAVVRVFDGVRADRALDVRFVRRTGKTSPLQPILSAIEVTLDD